MKKSLLFSALIGFAVLTQNCSNDDNRNDDPTEQQDFTNSKYIKSLMIGNWKMIAANYDGNWHNTSTLPGLPEEQSTYNFSENGSYVYKPYTKLDDNSMNESGTYTITAATNTINAKLNLKYSYNGTERTRTIILENYNDGIVEFSEISVICTTGTCKYKFQKQ